MPETNLFAIFGTDEGRVNEEGHGLARKLSEGLDPEFGLEVINGQADNADHASQIVGRTLEALQTMPFFGGTKVVWLQGANFFADNQTGKAQATLSAVDSLSDFLEAGVPADVQFLITASEIDKRRAFFKKVKKFAKIATYDKADIKKGGWEREVMDLAWIKAETLKLKIGHEALEHFVRMVGPDTRLLQNELEKLSLFVGEREA
ncbi:MAG: hypothetical protein HKN23_10140, partial [Verrucomicrobiales bacterium]|nr:hypothetical protein [Verrucomicrobiales bacterium]